MVSYYSSGLVTTTQVAFASSGRHVVVPFGNNLRVYDITSNPPSYTGCMSGHLERVTAVVEIGTMRIASSSKDGTVRIWDVLDGNCLSTVDIGQSICSMTKINQNKLLCFGLNGVTTINLDPKTRNVKEKFIKPSKMFTKSRGNVACSANGDLIACIDRKKIYLTSVERKFHRTVSINYPGRITALAISEDGTLMAIGTAAGVITIYRNPTNLFGEKGKQVNMDMAAARPASLHWHASAVRALHFSRDNAILLSGGQEGVLVTWKMTTFAFGTRSFLPRMGSSLLSISVSLDEGLYAVVQGNNSVSLVDPASNSVISNIRGITVPSGSQDVSFQMNDTDSPFASCKEACVIVDKGRPGTLLIAGRDGEVQAFNTFSGVQVSEFSVSTRNTTFESRSKRDEDEKPGNGQISHLCINNSGSQIATVEVQPLSVTSSSQFGTESVSIAMKIWKRTSADEVPELEALIPRPHGSDVEVTSICFHPSMPFLVSTSDIGSMKIWRKVLSHRKKDRFIWRSELEQKFRGLPCKDVCFSRDGSVLIAAYGHLVTLWHIFDLASSQNKTERTGVEDTEDDVNEFSPSSVNLEFEATLTHPPPEEYIEKVEYLNTKIPLVVCATGHGVYVWNLLTQGIWWSSRILHVPRCMVVDKTSGRFAIAAQIPGIVADQEENENSTSQSPGVKSKEAKDKTVSKRNSKIAASTEMQQEKMLEGEPEVSNSDTVQNSKKIGTVPKRKRSQTGLDYAISVFNALSPIPEGVIRMGTGVKIAALQFLTHSSGRKKQTVLVSISSNLDTSFHTFGGDLEDGKQHNNPLALSKSYEAVVNRPEASWILGLQENQNRAENELWVDVRDDQKLRELPKEHKERYVPHENGSVRSVLLKHFSGSIHLRPSCASSAKDIIQSLLEHVTISEKEGDIDTTKEETHISGNIQSTAEEILAKKPDLSRAPTANRDTDVESYAALQRFCATLV